MYRAHYGDTPLLLDQNFGPLDVTAALDDGGQVLTLAVMNLQEAAVTVKLDLTGKKLGSHADRHWVGGSDPEAFNTPGQPRQVDAFHDKVTVADGLEVPALSATIFRISLP